MGNQIRAELYRIRQRWLGLLLPLSLLIGGAGVLVLGCSLSSQLTISTSQVVGLGLQELLFLGVYFAVSCASFSFSDQYKHGTLKNEAVFGFSRASMYLARLTAAILLGLCLAAACLGSALLLSLVLLQSPLETLASFCALAPWVAGALPLWIASCSLCLCLEFCLKSDGLAVSLTILYLTIGWLVIGAFAVVGDGFLADGGRSFFFYLPLYLYAVHPIAPFSPLAIQIGSMEYPRAVYLDGSWGRAGLCWLIGAAWVAITTAVGIAVLRRRELR